MSDETFEVEAHAEGFYNDLKKPGDRFFVTERLFAKEWMKRVNPIADAIKVAVAPTPLPVVVPSVMDLRTIALMQGPVAAPKPKTAAEINAQSMLGPQPQPKTAPVEITKADEPVVVTEVVESEPEVAVEMKTAAETPAGDLL